MRSVAALVMGGGFSMAASSIWLDPSDLSTLRQEITGASATTAVAVGDPVGSMLNRGVIGEWLTAPSTGARPILRMDGSGRFYLEFDGVNDTLVFTSAQMAAIVGGPYAIFAAWLLRDGDSPTGSNRFVIGSGTGGVRVGWAFPNVLVFNDLESDGLSGESDTDKHVMTAIQSTSGRYVHESADISVNDADTTYLASVADLALSRRSTAFSQSDLYGMVIQAGSIDADFQAAVELRLAQAIGL
jgi:hypothetical protein